MKTTLKLVLAGTGTMLVLAFGLVTPLRADDATTEIQNLQKRLDELKAAQKQTQQQSPQQVQAQEAYVPPGNTSRNPDRFPSVGFSYSGAPGLTGNAEAFSGSASESRTMTANSFSLAADLRVPVSDTLTIFGAVSYSQQATELPETSVYIGQRNKLDGIYITLGARFYFVR